jgi:hypothetical protein
MTPNPCLDAALDYAKRGLRVIALHSPNGRGGCTCGKGDCGTPGKHPRWHKSDLEHGVHSATTDEKIIRRWWQRWPGANVGIATGKVSGVIAGDIDPRNGGDKSLKRLPGNFPITPTSRTGGKGDHYLLAYPDNCFNIKNDTDLAGFPGIDIKSDGGFIVAPPSSHISGEKYYWKRDLDTPFAPTPNWLLELIKKEDSHEHKFAPFGEVIPEGKRVKTLVSLAGTMRRRGMNESALLAALEALNQSQCEEPLPDSKIRDIARSYGKYPPGKITGEAQELPPDRRGQPAKPSQHPEPLKPTLNQAIILAQDFIALEIPPRKVHLSPWLNEASINMICGPRGIGKTMFAFSICESVARPAAFGAWAAGESVNVCYLDGELTMADISERSAYFVQQNYVSNFYIYSDHYGNHLGLPSANLLDEDWRKAMTEFLLSKSVKLWCVDNIASLAPGIDENSKKDWDPINRFFLDLRFAGIATIFVHHTGKEGQQRGTSGREDNIDISLMLDYPANYSREDGCKFIAKFTKTRIRHRDLHLIGDTEFTLMEDPEGGYVWTFKGARKATKIAVITLLNEGISSKDIAETLEVSPGRVSQIKTEAVSEGLITKAGKLTQSGMAYVQN